MALPKDAVDEIREYIEVQGIAWAREYIAGRQAYLRSQGMVASGELVSGLAFEIQSQLDQALQTRIALAFPEHGRFRDMKRINPPSGGGSYIENLEDWIRRKGFEQKFTEGFLRKRKVKRVPVNIVNQMAWGIALKRKIAYRRRGGWYAKSKTASITDLYNNIAAGLPDKVMQEIKAAFKT